MTSKALILGALFAACSVSSRAETVAIRDVTVLPMAGPDRLDHQTVIVQDGVIIAMGSAAAVKAPAGARTIDGRSRFLMPGLSDMHAHLEWEFERPEDPSGQPDDRLRLTLLSYLATGVTLVRDMHGSPARLAGRSAVARGEMVGPRMVVCSPILEGAKPVWSFSVKLNDPALAAGVVGGFARQGYDCIKAYHTLSPEVYGAVADATKAAHLPLVGHVPFGVGIEGALATGQSSVEHLRGYDFDGLSRASLELDGGRSPERMMSLGRMTQARRAELADKTAHAGTWNVPTMAVKSFMSERERRAALRNDPAYDLLGPAAQGQISSTGMDAIFTPQALEAQRQSTAAQGLMVKALHDAGAGLLIGTDSPVGYLVKGFTPIEEIGAFVDAGISPMDALRAATIGPARYLAAEASTGSIAIGKKTEMILLDADPAADTKNLWKLQGVLSQGRWRSKAELDQAIRELRARLPAS